MPKAWLSLGANIGYPKAQLAEAVQRLDTHPEVTVTSRSSVIITRPWGKTDQPDFANMAVAVETSLKPEPLLDACLAVERDMGRERIEVWGPRLIDIDIIAYDRLEITTERLTVPHPYAHERDFVLVPLREIDPATAEWVMERAKAGS
ncbi:2-amino-4-hydroxy-6-hydroxymethyldihydropteridine diphosphokinase [Devosia nitrariae]|nr:2-amino-4-hydroxy-6-hydroxymethyldihydropteridine diphosphokinase [Devosia nitrariae]